MEDSSDQIIREKRFVNNVEQIRNFIIHCLGFQPEDMTGGEFANYFTWRTNNSELKVIFYYGCYLEKEPDFFDYYIEIGDERSEGTYPFGHQFLSADEEAVSKIILPFKNTVENRKTLNVTSNIESKPLTKRYYVIQAFRDNSWQDVLFSHGDISTAEKKARHYRNKNVCDTRVIEVKESVNYSYDYKLINGYSKGGDR